MKRLKRLGAALILCLLVSPFAAVPAQAKKHHDSPQVKAARKRAKAQRKAQRRAAKKAQKERRRQAAHR